MKAGSFLTYLFCLFCVNLLIAQEADSLRLKKMMTTIESIYRAKRDTAIILLNQEEKKLNELKLKDPLSRTKMEFEFYDLAATVYHENGKLTDARRYYDLMLERTLKLKDTLKTAAINYCMGMLNHQEGNIPMAIKCYSIALETYELKKDQSNVALQWYSLAQVYGEQNDTIKELEYYKKSLEIYQSMNSNWGIALLQGAFGQLYLRHHNYNFALMFFRRNLDIYSAGAGDFWGIGNSFQSIGEVYKRMGKLDSAYNNFSRALEVRKKTGYKLGITITLNSIAQLFITQGEINKAENYALDSYAVAKEIGSPQNIRMSAKTLHTVYKRQKKFPKAFEMYEVFVRMTDSLQNEKNKKAIFQQQLSYEFDKKAALEEENQKGRDILAIEQKQRQKIVMNAVTGLLCLVFLLVIFIFRGYRQKKRANIAIIGQKKVIEEKQKEIIDSILYAKRIQLSLMPTEKYFVRKMSELRKKI